MTEPTIHPSRTLRVIPTVDLRRMHRLLVFTILIDFVDLIVGIIRIKGG